MKQMNSFNKTKQSTKQYIVHRVERAREKAEEIAKNNIRLLTVQHFAEWCDEEEEACTSLFLNGLHCTHPLTPRPRSSKPQQMKFRPH